VFSKKPNIPSNKLAQTPPKLPAGSKGISMLSQGCFFEGKVIMKGESRIGGAIQGAITSDSFLLLEVTSQISGEVHGSNIVLNGQVQGDITASEIIRLSSTAVVNGNIITKRLVVEDGAKINGKISYIAESSSPTKLQKIS
jgi:cytoskeletal protein CcmA (bactofilin family)